MNDNNRLTNLKAAALEFVSTVLDPDADHRISIAIVPFNGQVNLGTTLAAKFTLTDNPNVTGVTCVDLPASVYTTFGVSPTTSMPMTQHADTYTNTSGAAGTGTSATSPTSVTSSRQAAAAMPCRLPETAGARRPTAPSPRATSCGCRPMTPHGCAATSTV